MLVSITVLDKTRKKHLGNLGALSVSDWQRDMRGGR
jgi:hypothetical protein